MRAVAGVMQIGRLIFFSVMVMSTPIGTRFGLEGGFGFANGAT